MSGSTEGGSESGWAKRVELGVLGALIVIFALHTILHLYNALGGLPLPERVPWHVLIPLYASFSVVSSWLTIGGKRTVTFLILTFVISYSMELIGTQTDVLFGDYYYTDVLGWKLGPVPVLIPLAYYMLVYPAYLMTNLILDGQPTSTTRSLGRRTLVAILPAGIMTGWDLAYDPLMAFGYEAWIWVEQGPYFGVPLRNFLGWFLTSYLIALSCSLAEPLELLKPGEIKPHRWVSLLALLSFAALGVGILFAGHPEGTRIVGPFVMGIPLVAALFRLYPGKAVTASSGGK